jgi:hypothetical protein
MFHLDYLSCFLTVLATILLARKSWIGLLVAIANSLIVCVIGLRTSQLGFIPANLFCIGVYAFSMRSWLKERTHANRDQGQRRKSLVVPTHNGAPQKGLPSSHCRSSILKLTSATRIGLPEDTMHADLTFMALAHESNRYLLTRLIAKATRKLHRPNTRLQDTMNDVFERFGCSKPRADRPAVEAASSSEGRAA